MRSTQQIERCAEELLILLSANIPEEQDERKAASLFLELLTGLCYDIREIRRILETSHKL
jgi:hypothetical protein